MAAGLVIENLSVAQGDALRAAVRQAAPAGAGRVLRRPSAPRCGWTPSPPTALAGARAGRACGSSAIRLGVAAGLRGLRPGSAAGAARLDGPRVAGRHHAGLRLGGRQRVRRLGRAGADAAGGRDRGERARRAGGVPARLSDAGELDDAGAAAAASSSRTASPICTCTSPTARSPCKPATGGVAVALDALMRERGGVWIAHGAGDADRAVVDAGDHVPVPPDQPSYALRRLWIDERDVRRATTAASPTRGCGRCATTWTCGRSSAARTGRPTRQVNESFAGGHRRRARPIATRRCSSRTITWRSWRRRCARGGPTCAPRCSGTSRGRIRTGCASARGGARCCRACWPTIWWRSRSSATGATSCWRWTRSSTPRSTSETSRVHFGGRRTTVVAVPIGVDFDRIQAIAADAGLAGRTAARCATLLGLEAEIIGLGVDRLDYTKGIPERLDALDPLVHAAARPARPPDVRADRRAVAVGAGKLRGDRSGDRSARRRHQPAACACTACRSPALPHGARSTVRAWSRSTAWRTSASSARCTTA